MSVDITGKYVKWCYVIFLLSFFLVLWIGFIRTVGLTGVPTGSGTPESMKIAGERGESDRE